MYPFYMMNSQSFGLTQTISSIETVMGSIEEVFAHSSRLSLLYKASLHFSTTITKLRKLLMRLNWSSLFPKILVHCPPQPTGSQWFWPHCGHLDPCP